MKTATLSPTQSKIQGVKREIVLTRAKIAEQTQAILEFEEAIQLIESDAKYVPEPGQLVPFDQLKELLSQQETEAEKEQKMAAARQALINCKFQQSSNFQDLENYQNYLVFLQNEDQWEREYLPYAARYRSSFSVKSALERRQQEINNLERDIISKKQILDQAQQWLNAPYNSKPRYLVSPPLHIPESAVKYLPKAIPDLEGQLKALQEKPVTESPAYQQKFREHVKARVLVEEPLKKFLKAQSDYLTALGGLHHAFDQIPQRTIDVDIQELGLRKKLIVDEDGCIRHA